MNDRALHLQLHMQRDDFRLSVTETLPAIGIVAITGPSGAGKTSLLRSIAGFERINDGIVRFGDDTWQDETQNTFIPPHRRGVGMVFQEPRLFEHLSVEDNLRYGWRRKPQESRRLDWAEVVETLGLSALLPRHPRGLSGGERQRVALARSLLAGPRLLLLDEALSGLDRTRKDVLLSFLAALPQRYGLPLFYVSHHLEEIIQLADHLVLLEDGRITGHGPLTSMLQRLDLSLAQREDAGAVLTAEITGHDEHYHLTHLRFADQQLMVSRVSQSAGTQVRLLIQARDVSLTLETPQATTILNALPCRITAIAAAPNPAQQLIGLECAGQGLLARVTRKSCEQLGLHEGMRVHAQIKSVALTR